VWREGALHGGGRGGAAAVGDHPGDDAQLVAGRIVEQAHGLDRVAEAGDVAGEDGDDHLLGEVDRRGRGAGVVAGPEGGQGLAVAEHLQLSGVGGVVHPDGRGRAGGHHLAVEELLADHVQGPARGNGGLRADQVEGAGHDQNGRLPGGDAELAHQDLQVVAVGVAPHPRDLGRVTGAGVAGEGADDAVRGEVDGGLDGGAVGGPEGGPLGVVGRVDLMGALGAPQARVPLVEGLVGDGDVVRRGGGAAAGRAAGGRARGAGAAGGAAAGEEHGQGQSKDSGGVADSTHGGVLLHTGSARSAPGADLP
jgi:hypothetical protein